MKDYIYLDSNLLNSNLAQVFDGLPTTFTSEEGALETNSESSGSDNQMKVGVSPAGVGAEYSTKISSSTDEVLTSSQKEVLESQFHDNSVDRLINKLKEDRKLIEKIESAREGNIVLLENSFSIIDFDYLEKISETEDVFGMISSSDENLITIDTEIAYLHSTGKRKSKRYNQLNRKKKEIKQEFIEQMTPYTTINKFSKYAKRAFPDTVVVRTEKALTLCSNNSFRNSQTQILNLVNSKRNITILGIVIGEKDNLISADKDFSKIEDFQPHQIGMFPSIIADMLLNSFSLLQEGDKIIKPIAIYFEE